MGASSTSFGRRIAGTILDRRQHIGVIIISLVLAVLAMLSVKAVLASQKVVAKPSQGAPALKGQIDPTRLKGEGDGRINILLLGVGGAEHTAGALTDTIMVASIDPIHKDVAMLSIPRDLYVKIPGYGAAKINAAGTYGGPELSKQVVSQILDLPIHYYIQADFGAFKQSVDAVGGVQVNPEKALYDPDYPCDNGRNYCPFSLKPGAQKLNGATALKYVRCRHGVCEGDFGRAARQQEVLLALRHEVLAAKTLTNPIKMSALIDGIGDHVRMDLQLNEVQKLAELLKDAKTDTITTKVLTNEEGGLLVNGSNTFKGAGSILLPRAGSFDYSEIQELVHTIFADGYLKKESPKIEIVNASGRTGLADRLNRQLSAYSYQVVGTTTATQQQPTTQLVDYSNGTKPYTVRYLQQRFKAPVVKGDPAAKPASSADIVIMVGKDYQLPTQP